MTKLKMQTSCGWAITKFMWPKKPPQVHVAKEAPSLPKLLFIFIKHCSQHTNIHKTFSNEILILFQHREDNIWHKRYNVNVLGDHFGEVRSPRGGEGRG